MQIQISPVKIGNEETDLTLLVFASGQALPNYPELNSSDCGSAHLKGSTGLVMYQKCVYGIQKAASNPYLLFIITEIYCLYYLIKKTKVESLNFLP